jgi:hypothetical protein
MSRTNEYPPGWDERRVRELLDFYESQTDEEAAAEHEAALSSSGQTLMEVPTELVPIFRQLIAEHRKERAAR